MPHFWCFPSRPGADNQPGPFGPLETETFSPPPNPFPKPAPSFANIPVILLLFCAHEVKIFFFFPSSPFLPPPPFTPTFLPKACGVASPVPASPPPPRSQLLAPQRRIRRWRGGGCPERPLLLPHNFFQACREFHCSPADADARFWGFWTLSPARRSQHAAALPR